MALDAASDRPDADHTAGSAHARRMLAARMAGTEQPRDMVGGLNAQAAVQGYRSYVNYQPPPLENNNNNNNNVVPPPLPAPIPQPVSPALPPPPAPQIMNNSSLPYWSRAPISPQPVGPALPPLPAPQIAGSALPYWGHQAPAPMPAPMPAGMMMMMVPRPYYYLPGAVDGSRHTKSSSGKTRTRYITKYRTKTMTEHGTCDARTLAGTPHAAPTPHQKQQQQAPTPPAGDDELHMQGFDEIGVGRPAPGTASTST
ncbi:hypothetical protein H4R18_002175 [Coemansia javaensis]|uniref:Uncharacterized protein n=1 Tax=Coemansia javaensis TaxID=2761396 RepID=A0A9W8HF99_9FUNG|nr:hypothetical protein H4R18_002175 [Coemansia javaensis]